jgi:hypothetical protein
MIILFVGDELIDVPGLDLEKLSMEVSFSGVEGCRKSMRGHLHFMGTRLLVE